MAKASTRSAAPAQPVEARRGIAGLDQGPVGLVMSIAAIAVCLSLVFPAFIGPANLDSILFAWSILIVVALAQAIVVGAGDMSLAVGAIAGLSVVVAGGLMESHHIPTLISVIAALAVAAGCGALNGWLINRTGLSSFIVTLATASVYAGVTLGITSGLPYYGLPADFLALGSWNLFGLPAAAVIAALVSAALWALFRFLGFGRQILATGSRREAAVMLGVDVESVRVVVHAISGSIAGAAGLLLAARVGAAQPTIGEEWLLVSFAAPIIGGAALAGGSVPVFGTVLGALLLTIVNNALVFLSVTAYWAQLPSGLIILAAVGLDRARQVRQERLDRYARIKSTIGATRSTPTRDASA